MKTLLATSRHFNFLFQNKSLLGPVTPKIAMVESSVADSVEYLKSLESIRARCQMVFQLAKEGKSDNFTMDLSRLPEASDLIIQLIGRDYGPFVKETLVKIPPHGRWLHFGPTRVDDLIELIGKDEALPAVLDLFVVAVLLDAGAGDKWKFTDKFGQVYTRSEGLAVAAYEMFMKGLFSSNPANPYQVDSIGLASLTVAELSVGMQVSDCNPLVGLEGRFNLLKRLGSVIAENQQYFAGEVTRPSNFMGFLEANAQDDKIEIDSLWEVVSRGFGSIWPPAGAKLDGASLGDAWTLPLSGKSGKELIVPFHKLSQWLTYSLMVPVEKLSKYIFVNAQKMTGLPEYRNGGVFVDLGILKLKDNIKLAGLNRAEADKEQGVPAYNVNEPVIVEWRALTICLLDLLAADLRCKLGASEDELSLPMVLEAGTWKAGRELSAKLRPSTKNPPISIISDGTVF